MFSTNTYNIQELISENYTDLDDMREKPLAFKQGQFFLIVEPVRYGDHPQFLKDMFKFVTHHQKILGNVHFLSAWDYKDKSAVQKAIEQVLLYNVTKEYKRFVKDTESFITRWGYFAEEKKGELKKTNSRRIKRRILYNFKADEILHILLAMFCYNYEVVKKKSLELLQMLHGEKVTSSRTSSDTAIKFPKYSDLRSGSLTEFYNQTLISNRKN